MGPPGKPVRTEVRLALVLALIGLTLRLAFTLRRPELARSASDALFGFARGAALDVSFALVVTGLAGLVNGVGARRLAIVAASTWAILSAALAGFETEYFAFSRNRLDATFVAYAREWRALGGSVAGEASFAWLALHLVVAVVGAFAVARALQPESPRSLAPSVVMMLVGASASAWLATHVRQASTWFGDEVSRHPLVELSKALGRDEARTLELDQATVEAARAYSNPLGTKRFLDASTPLAHALASGPSGAFGTHRGPLNFVYVMLEGMEASALSASGGTAGLTPELDKLSAKNIYFKNFYANGSHTPRALDAALCGLVPRLTGAPLSRAQPRMPVRCLPGILRDEGYATGFVHGGMEAFENRFEFLGRIGFRDTVFFEQFGRNLPTSNGGWGATDAQTYDRALDWLDRRDRSAPFFLTVLSISNHHPFHVPDPALELDHDEPLLPNNTTRYADREAGRFLAALEARGLLDDTVVFVFGDHGLTRSNVNADAGAAAAERLLTRANVPLLVLGPKDVLPPAQVVDKLASQDDLVPTVLELAGLKVATHAFGHSLGFALGPAGRDLPVLVHDVYSQLVADVRPGTAQVTSLDGSGQADGTWSWRREAGRVVAERGEADPARRASVESVVRTVEALYGGERWWSASLAADRR